MVDGVKMKHRKVNSRRWVDCKVFTVLAMDSFCLLIAVISYNISSVAKHFMNNVMISIIRKSNINMFKLTSQNVFFAASLEMDILF